MALKSAYFQSLNSVGKHDTKKIKKLLDTLPGVTSVSVNEKVGNITVDYDSSAIHPDQITEKLSPLGLSLTEDVR
ncbi:MAG: heavy metal-associated domain-containing protein [Bacillota bacterium]